MASTTYLITGASRGLGLETCRQLLSVPGNLVIAAARDPATSQGLQELVAKYPEGRLETVKLDVSSEESIASAVDLVKKMQSAEAGIDVLINNAGVFAGGHAGAQESSIAQLSTNLAANLFGVISTTLAFLPLLRQGREKKIYIVSSIMGSIGGPLGETPFGATYSVSKAAVNMWAVKLARELDEEGFSVVPFHPGYVKTDMNGGLEGPAAITVEDSVEQTIKHVILPRHKTATFMVYDGTTLPW